MVEQEVSIMTMRNASPAPNPRQFRTCLPGQLLTKPSLVLVKQVEQMKRDRMMHDPTYAVSAMRPNLFGVTSHEATSCVSNANHRTAGNFSRE